jgi:hypothetical protein
LEKYLRDHEEVTPVQRDRSAACFAEPGGASLLLCSEIDALKQKRDALLSAVSAARLRLDAMRLIVKGKGF